MPSWSWCYLLPWSLPLHELVIHLRRLLHTKCWSFLDYWSACQSHRAIQPCPIESCSRPSFDLVRPFSSVYIAWNQGSSSWGTWHNHAVHCLCSIPLLLLVCACFFMLLGVCYCSLPWQRCPPPLEWLLVVSFPFSLSYSSFLKSVKDSGLCDGLIHGLDLKSLQLRLGPIFQSVHEVEQHVFVGEV